MDDNFRLIMLPGDPFFNQILASPPPDYKEKSEKLGEGISFVKGENGVFRSASLKEIEEYFYGGEYDEFENQEIEDEELDF